MDAIHFKKIYVKRCCIMIKKKSVLATATVLLLLTGCALSNTKKSDNTSDPVSAAYNTDSDTNKDIISNPKNEVGNGYVIIHDESDYPSCLKDFRYGNNI